ncbi:MAG: stage V sporulation protein AC [Acetobacteraceae bacterium]|nr:stage V sporulation protein AC [Acetobacteraceae bacterium]
MKATPGQARRYQELVSAKTPRKPVARNAALAFLVGGAICALGQVAFNLFVSRGLDPVQAAAPTAGVVVLLGALLTGIGIYDELGRFGGMGAALPISGFANSIVSPAMEFKREGLVLGVGAKMFTVAGPVIVYGLVTAYAVAVARWLLLGG